MMMLVVEDVTSGTLAHVYVAVRARALPIAVVADRRMFHTKPIRHAASS